MKIKAMKIKDLSAASLKTVCVLTALWLVHTMPVAAQVEMSNQSRAQGVQPFTIDVLNFQGDNNQSRLDLYIAVSYARLGFVKQNDRFTATYEVTADFFDSSNGSLAFEKIWSETVVSPGYDESMFSANKHLTYRSVVVSPGLYRVAVQIRDVETGRTYQTQQAALARPFYGKAVLMSSVMLLAQNSLDSLGRRTITPLVSAPVLQSKEGARFFFEIYADSITRGPLIAQYTIRSVGKKAEDVDVQRHRVIVDQKRVQVFDNVNLEKVSSGDYVVKVSLIDSAGRFFTEAERPLQVRAAGLVSYIRDLDKAVEQLLYAATSEEISRITEVKTESDRLQRFNEFWKKRDPTPKSPENELMAEYYSRIEYANQNFSHYIEGWKTDMGMIFIKYGQPDFVDRRPFNFDTKPYEIWEFYQKNRRFTFVDETGFGDYRLTKPEWDMRNRLR